MVATEKALFSVPGCDSLSLSLSVWRELFLVDFLLVSLDRFKRGTRKKRGPAEPPAKCFYATGRPRLLDQLGDLLRPGFLDLWLPPFCRKSRTDPRISAGNGSTYPNM